jgi:flagellum-specific peptidoglycan hydrolase FlgJ
MAIADDAPAKTPTPTNPQEFVKIYGPIADQVGKEIGVDPRVILGQWGMETRWGSAVIGDYNLGNIKDPSGKGKRAEDKKEGSNDPYLSFESPEGFGQYYSDYMKRGFPNAIGSGADISKFTAGLAKGVNGSYFGKTKPEEYQTALAGGYDSAAKIYGQSEAPAQQESNPFGDVKPLPSFTNDKPENKRPNLEGMPDWYKNLSPKIRDREGDISTGTIGTAGALLGLPLEFANKGLAKMEGKVSDAKAAFEAARIAARSTAGASADTAQKLAAEAQRLEAEYRASLAGYQALERELAESIAESKRFLPPDPEVRGKVAGASGSENYARKMPGQLPPEAMLSQVEDMTTGKNPRGMGAGDIAAKNAANIETQKRLGMGNYQMTGTGSQQMILSPEDTALRQAQMDAAGQKAKQLSPLAQAAQAEVDTAKQARETAEKVRQRETAAAQKTAREARTTALTAQSSLKSATQQAPSGIGKIGALAQKIPGTNIVAGLGMGMSAAEALNRYEKGDTSGAVLSTVQTVLDGMAMLPPGTPVTAFLKGIGVVGGLATTAYDIFRTKQMEYDEKLKNQPQQARGGLTLMR